MIQIGDRVQVGSRIGAKTEWGTVVDEIPANDYRQAMYRIRFDSAGNDVVTLTPTPNECWVDKGLIHAAYHQNIGWDN